MTRITFGVSASSFIANMCVKQNAQLPFLWLQRLYDSFYVDDGLTGADSSDEVIQLQNELQTLLEKVVSYYGNGIPVSLMYSNKFLLSFVINNQYAPSLNLIPTRGPWESSGVSS